MEYTSDNPSPACPRWVPTCALCNNTVELETCKVDESGESNSRRMLPPHVDPVKATQSRYPAASEFSRALLDSSVVAAHCE